MSPRLAGPIAASLIAIASPTIAQNGAAPAPQTSAPASPAPGTIPPSPPQPGATPPVVTIPPEAAPAAPVPVETAPAPTPAAPAPVTISPDAAYPNGFADPEDPFGNDLSLARQNEGGGFPWGLLGLLGLFGLLPLFRRQRKTTRTVYVDSKDPQRVIREEQVDE